jgi:DNA-binding MarR family transcriptional regulator
VDSVAAELVDWLAQMPDVSSDVEAARQRIGRLSRLFVRVLEAVSAEQGISITDLETLSVIRRNGSSTTPGRIAAELHLTSGSVSTRLRRLERAGLAEADTADSADGRLRQVRLTPAGLRIWRDATERRTTREASLFATLDETQLRTLNEALAQLLARLEQEFGTASRHDHNPAS